MKDDVVNPVIRDFVRSHPDINIDRYSGKGGFGELYFGTRNVLGDRVALKFYQLDASGKAHDEPRLLQEIKHENILPILDARVIDNNIAYYLTPEISSGDLQNVIDSSNICTDTAINIIQGVLKGLNELHKSPRNLVHRDLKPGNILIDLNCNKTYLADFGSIKKIPDGSDNVSASTFTFIYRPVEVVNFNTYFKQSDIYQIGVVLFQVLGGFFPLKSPSLWLRGRARIQYDKLMAGREQEDYLISHVEDLIKKGKLFDYSTLMPFVNKRLKSIIKTATHPDYSKRYQSCAEFLRALFDYNNHAKNWWVESGVTYSYCKKNRRTYRIVVDKKHFIVEAKNKNLSWRKKKAFSSYVNSVGFIEND